jgi:hypothetical protein
MKHKSINQLKYDGSIEDYLKQKSISKNNPELFKSYQTKVGKLAKHLAKKFSDVKNVYFIEVAKIAIELAQKKQRDTIIRENASITNESYTGSIELLQYLKGIESNTLLTHDIVIKYSEPNPNGTGKMKKTKLILEGSALIKSFEQLLLKEYMGSDLAKSFPKRATKLQLFSNQFVKEEQFENQYAKVACKEITFLLNKSNLDKKVLKAIVIHALENVRLIERYSEYLKRIKPKMEKDYVEIESYTLWISRTYTSIIR